MHNTSQTIFHRPDVAGVGATPPISVLFDYRRPQPWLFRLCHRTVRVIRALWSRTKT
jgi:hypothetical protein